MDASEVQRFWDRVEKIPLTGCWLWTGSLSKDMYAHWTVSVNGRSRTRLGHRLAYELLVGPIPKGLVLDHLCKVRFCVNPAHLEPVTQKENVRRGKCGEAGARFQREKTQCPAGHLYDEANTYVRGDGSRHCRACARLRAAQKREAKRAESPPSHLRRKDECGRGHSRDEHAYWNGKQFRCRPCTAARGRRWKAKKRQEAAQAA